ESVVPEFSAPPSYSFGPIPSVLIFRYKLLRSSPRISAVRVTFPFVSSCFFKMYSAPPHTGPPEDCRSGRWRDRRARSTSKGSFITPLARLICRDGNLRRLGNLPKNSRRIPKGSLNSGRFWYTQSRRI